MLEIIRLQLQLCFQTGQFQLPLKNPTRLNNKFILFLIISDLTEHWGFIMEYERAFRPCYVCTNKLQGDGVGLSDFYMEWLLAIASLEKMSGNRFSEKLAATLRSRLELLKENRAFKMALYLDPRFNFVGSTIFKPDEKEEIQVNNFEFEFGLILISILFADIFGRHVASHLQASAEH